MRVSTAAASDTVPSIFKNHHCLFHLFFIGSTMDRHILCRTLLGQAVMLITGIVFYSIILLLAYNTYRSASGDQSYCTLWTDVPGRLSILLISCYVAGACGCFPLPDCWRLQCLPRSFMWWKIWTWRDQLTRMYRDRCFAMHMERHPPVPYRFDEFFHDSPRNADFLGPCLSISPICREGSHRERLSRNTNVPSYGATRVIQVPSSRNPNGRFRREDFTSTFASGDSGNWTFGTSVSSDVPNHPQIPWSELEVTNRPHAPVHQKTGVRNKFELPAVKKLKIFSHNSEGCGPSPKRSLRRRRCITDPSSGYIHELITERTARRSEQSCLNAGTGESGGMQHSEDAGSPDFVQFHMSLENSDRDLRSSTAVETAERAQDADKAESDEDEHEYEH